MAAKKTDEPQVAKVEPEVIRIPITLKRDTKVGEIHAKFGSVIAYVELAPGVSLNYVVDAIRNGVAGEANV